jgi:hypothetical protein
MTLDDTERLSELVCVKRECLRQILGLGRRQLELIEDGDLGQLLGLLGEKERLIAELHRWERALDPYRDQDPLARRWRSEADRLRCREVIRDSERMFREILEQEQQSESRLRLRRDEAAARLQGTHVAHQALGAYTSGQRTTHNELDVSSDS